MVLKSSQTSPTCTTLSLQPADHTLHKTMDMLKGHAVQTVNKLLKGATDPHIALLLFQSTPQPWCSIYLTCRTPDGKTDPFKSIILSPSIIIPQPEESLLPRLGDRSSRPLKLSLNSNRRISTRVTKQDLYLISLDPQTDVWITKRHSPGIYHHCDHRYS